MDSLAGHILEEFMESVAERPTVELALGLFCCRQVGKEYAPGCGLETVRLSLVDGALGRRE